jgi:hypothetical protein
VSENYKVFCAPRHLRINMCKFQKGELEIAMLLYAVCLAAWITHLYVCFSDGRWGFLIAGAIFFPVAIIHGAGTWVGLW